MAKQTAKRSTFMTWWHRRRERRSLVARARHLAKEAHRLARRKRKKIAPEVAESLQSDARSLRQRLKQRPLDGKGIAELSERLDQTLEQHLKWARKSVTREYIESIAWAVGIALLIRAFLFEAFEIPTGSMIPTLKVNDHIFVNKFLFGMRIPYTHTRFFEWRTPHPGEIIVFEFPGPGPDHGKDFIKRVVAVAGDRVRLKDNVISVNGRPLPTVTFRSGQALVNGRPVAGLLMPEWFGTVPCEDDDLMCRESPNGCCRCVLQWERNGDYGYVTQHIDAFGPNCLPHRNMPNWPKEFKECPEPTDMSCEYWGNRTSPDEQWTGEAVVPPGNVFCMGDNRDKSHDGRYWKTVPLENVKGKAWIIWWAEDLKRLFSCVH